MIYSIHTVFCVLSEMITKKWTIFLILKAVVTYSILKNLGSRASGKETVFAFHRDLLADDPIKCNLIKETRMLPPKECDIHEKFSISHVLITGSARSGTTMTANLISSLFFQFSQDTKPPTRHGMVSWELAAPPIANKCSSFWHVPDSINIRFRRVYHLVRDPLDVIRSLITVRTHWEKNPDIVKRVIPDLDFQNRSSVYLALKVWVDWNAHIDRYSSFIPRHRVEDLDILSLLTDTGLDVAKTHPFVTNAVVHQCYSMLKGLNTRESKLQNITTGRYTWEYLKSVDMDYATRAQEMAHNYGYVYNEDDTLRFPNIIETEKESSGMNQKLSGEAKAALTKCKLAAKLKKKRRSPVSPFSRGKIKTKTP